MGKTELAGLMAKQVIAERTETGKVNEAMVGIVTDNKDPEKLGRVKVKYPTFTEAETSFWCPLVMLGAGKNRGWFFIPEVEDEVLVLFEHGNPNRGIVVGAVWNGKDKPPDKNPGPNPRRSIKSRQGSKVIFDDEKDLISIEDGGGKGKITLDAKNNKIIIEALEGDVAIQAPEGEIKIVTKETCLKATETIVGNVGETFGVTSEASATIKGTKTLQLTGGPDVKINSGGSGPSKVDSTPVDVADKYGS